MTDLSGLKPDPRNARRRTDRSASLIAKSLEQFGAARSIVIDENGRILAGNGTVEGAKAAGISKVRIVEADGSELIAVRRTGLTEEQKVGLALADNRTSDLSEWDGLMLQELAADQDLAPWFEDDELLAEVLEPEQGNTDPDDVPEAPEEPVTKPGDLWILGNHRLLCGDSTNPQHVERLMDGQKADMLHTDPPYGVDYEGVNNDDLKAEKLRAFIKDALTNAFVFLREGANAYVWHADIHAYEFIGAFRDSGFTQARPSTIQWVKDSLVLSQGDYHLRNEPCLYGWKPGKNRVRVKDRKQDTIWEYPKPKKANGHPTMKPVELCRRAICNSSEQRAIVLDLFGGSGSTLIACEQDHRAARLMELDPAYCDVIVKRWEDFTGKKAILEESKEAF